MLSTTLTLLIVVGLVSVHAQTLNDVKSLHDYLFTTQGYNKKIRPVWDQTQSINVSVHFYLSSIIDFDGQEESLTVSGFLSLYWWDQALVWNTTSFGGAYMMFVPQEDVWKPDISLRNSFKSFKGLGVADFNTWVFWDGLIFWEPFQVLKSTCAMDITYFPFDTQTCAMKLIAWSYPASHVRLLPQTTVTPVILNNEQFTSNSQWAIVDSSATSDSKDGSVTYSLMLKRKPLFYVANVILPVIMLSLLNIVTFVLPSTSGERASFSVTVFLSLAVFLTIVASELPNNSDVTSHLSVYLILMSGMSTLIALVSVFQLRLVSRDNGGNAPDKIATGYRLMHAFVQMLRCRRMPCRGRRRAAVEPTETSTTVTTLSTVSCSVLSMENMEKENMEPALHQDTTADVHSTQSIQSEQEVDEEEEEENLRWVDVVNGLDFLLFCITSIITIISTIILFVVATHNPQNIPNKYSHIHQYSQNPFY